MEAPPSPQSGSSFPSTPGPDTKKGCRGCFTGIAVLAGALAFVAIVESIISPHKSAPSTAPVSPTPTLPSYEIIKKFSPSPDRISYDIRVGYIDGLTPTREQIQQLGETIHFQNPRATRMNVFYYLPDMEPGAGAFATTHFAPDLQLTYDPDTTFSAWLADYTAKYSRSFDDDPVVNALYDEFEQKYIVDKSTLKNHEVFMNDLKERLDRRIHELAK